MPAPVLVALPLGWRSPARTWILPPTGMRATSLATGGQRNRPKWAWAAHVASKPCHSSSAQCRRDAKGRHTTLQRAFGSRRSPLPRHATNNPQRKSSAPNHLKRTVLIQPKPTPLPGVTGPARHRLTPRPGLGHVDAAQSPSQATRVATVPLGWHSMLDSQTPLESSGRM